MSRGHAKQARRWARKFNRQQRAMRKQVAAIARMRHEWKSLTARQQAEIAARGKQA